MIHTVCRKISGGRQLIKMMLLIVVLLLGALHHSLMAQRLEGVSDFVITDPSGSSCSNTREFRPLAWKIIGGNYNVNDLTIVIDWGDGSPFSQYPVASLAPNITISYPNANTTNINYITDSSTGMSHTYAKSKECMYIAVPALRLQGMSKDMQDGKLYKITIWSTDGDPDGMGEKSFVESETFVTEYLVCKGQTFSVNFLNNSKIACNSRNETPPKDGTNWVYTPLNNAYRHYRFTYGKAGDQIPNVTVGGVSVPPGTSYIPNGGRAIQWPNPGPLPDYVDYYNELTQVIESLNTSTANVGDIFTITLELWNECNPVGDPNNPNPPGPNDVIEARIKIVDAPPPIIPQTLTYCNYTHNGGNAYDYTMNLNHAPWTGADFTPGKYMWYAVDPSTNPNAQPIVTDNFSGSSYYTFNPYTHRDMPVANRIKPGTAGVYRYWVVYEYTGTDAAGQEYVCPTDPVPMTWIVRENIYPAIDAGKISGLRAVCSGGKVTLTIDPSTYPDSYTHGGLVDYIWSTPTVSGSTGVTVTNVAQSGSRNRTISFDVDPTWSQISGSNGKVTLTVHREWNTATSSGSKCPSEPTTIEITIYPRPTATLKTTTPDVCANVTPTMIVTNIGGASGSKNFTVLLNDGSGFTNNNISGKTQEVTVTNLTPVTGASVTEYFVYTVRDNTTGCVSTNKYDGTPAQLIPNSAGAPVQVIRRADLTQAAYSPPNTITPPNGSLLCSGSSQIFDVTTPPADINHPGLNVSTGGAPATNPAAKAIATQYGWRWSSTSTVTYNTSNTYTVNNVGTTNSANGLARSLFLFRRYADGKCGQSNTRTWNYTVVPNPTATIPSQTIEVCENATGDVTVNFTTTGYNTGGWTVEWRLAGNGMGAITGTATAAANTTGRSSGTITIPLASFTGNPNKYGTYTVTLTSVRQNNAAGCTGTITGAAQSIKLLRKPVATLSGNAQICEGANYTLPANSVAFAGEPGNYSITYRTRNNGGTITCNNVAVDPVTNGQFTIDRNCIDNAAAGNNTTVELITVTQGACSGDVSGSFVIEIDKYPETANINPVSPVCATTIPISATNASGTWSISNRAGDIPPTSAPGDYGFGNAYGTHTSTNPSTSFDIQNNAYGRYALVWTVGSAGSICPASTDTIVVNLSTSADPANITTPDQIVCGYTVTLETPDVLNSWETGVWSMISSSTGGNITSNVPATSGPNNRTITVDRSGTYEFEWRRDVPAPCSPTFKTVSITFGDIPVVDWGGLNTSYCPGEAISVGFSEISGKGIPAGQISYQWIPANTIGSYPAGNTQTDNPLAATAPANNTSIYVTYAIQQVQAINTVTNPAYSVPTVRCPSAAKNFNIIVKPTPKIGNINDINVCPDESITYNLDPSLTNATATNTDWTWTNTSTTATGGLTPALPISGTTVTVTPQQPTTQVGGFLVAEPNTIELQVSVEGCPSNIETFTITVNPTPVPTVTSGTQPLCPNTADVLTFTNVVADNDIEYTWTYTGNNTDLTSSGATTMQTYSLNYTTRENLTDANTTSTFTATAYGLVTSDISNKVCQESSTPLTITVKPRPNMRAMTDQKRCAASGNFDHIIFDLSNRGSRTANYTWVNNGDASIAGTDETETVLSQTTTSYNGSGTTAGIRNITIPNNTTNADIAASITVTPTMDGCVGDDRTVTLTAMRLPVVGTIADDIVCPDASFIAVYPYVSNTNISRIDFAITNSAPASVKISGNAGATSSYTVYTNNDNVQFVAMDNTTGANLITSVSVTATGSDLPDGATVGCVGPAENFTLTVKPTPVINAPVNNTATPIQELCPGESFNPVVFNSNITSDPANVEYRWTVQDYNIGSGMNGTVTGNGSSMTGFTGIANVSGNKITSTIQVTATLDGCASTPVRFTQRLKPTPQMKDLPDLAYCPGTTVGVVGITHNVSGRTTEGVKWQVDNIIVEAPPQAPAQSVLTPGLNTWQNGNTPSFEANANPATMVSPPDLVSIFTVSATVDGCEGNTDTYEVHINPTPDIQGTNDINLCNGEGQPMISFSSQYYPGQVSYEWERTDVIIGTPNPLTQGTGSIPGFTARNTSTGMLTDVTSTVIVRSKTSAGCPSPDETFDITIRAVPQLKYSDITICADSLITPAAFALQNPNANNDPVTYNWTFLDNWDAVLDLPSTGTGNLPNFSPDISAGSSLWADDARMPSRIQVAIELNGCTNQSIINSEYFTLQVNPLPTTVWVNEPTTCVEDGGKQIYQADTGSGTNGSYYYWGFKTLNSSPGEPTLEDPANTRNYTVFSFPTPVDLWEGIVHVRERNKYGCWGDTLKKTVNIQPTPLVLPLTDRTLCYGDTININARIRRVKAGATILYNWQPSAVIIAGQNDSSTVARPLQTMEISLNVEVDGCRSNSSAMTATVNPKPGTLLIYDRNYCENDPLWNMNVETNSIGAGNAIQWWRDDNGTLVNIGNSNNQTVINMKDETLHPGSVPNPIPYDPAVNDQASIIYYVGQTNSFNCSSDPSKATMILRATPPPPATITEEYCFVDGQVSYQIDQTGNNVRWYYPDTTTQNIGQGNTFWANTGNWIKPVVGTHTYYVTQRGSNGCESFAAAKDLVIHPIPQINFTLHDINGAAATEGCADFTVIATNTSVEADVNYTWDWGDGSGTMPDSDPPGTGTPKTHIYTNSNSTPESHLLVLTGISSVNKNNFINLNNAVNGKYCQSDKSQTLTVYPIVEARFIMSADSGCNVFTPIFTGSLSVKANEYKWYWNWTGANPPTPTDAADAFVPNLSHAFTNTDKINPATYHVYLQVSNGICHDLADTIITVLPVPSVDFAHNLPTNSICPPDSVLFTNLSSPAGNPNRPDTKYEWNFGDGVLASQDISLSQDIYHRYYNLGYGQPITRNAILTASNVFGTHVCSSSTNRYVTINPEVNASFGGDTAGCSPATATFYDLSEGAVTYVWDWGDGTTPLGSGRMATHQYQSSSRTNVEYYRVLLTASNPWCSDTVSHPFKLKPQPAASFVPDKIIGCQPLEVTFTNTSTGNPATGMEYTFLFEPGSSVIETDVNVKPVYSFANMSGSNQKYTPSLTATNQWGCTNTYTTDLTVYPYVLADFNIRGDSAGCAPLTVDFINGSRGFSSFLWEFGDGDMTSTVQTPRHVYNNNSMYQTKYFDVKLTVTSGANCSDSQTKQVVVYGNPVADFRPAAPYPSDYLYPAPPIQMENLIPLPDRDNLTYLWSYNEQGASYTNNFSSLEYPDPLRITTWGRFDITQKVTSPDGHCSDSKMLTINIVPPAPLASFDPVDPACAPYTVQFRNTSKYGKAYLWSFGDGTTSNAENPEHLYADAGTYTVTLTVTGDNTYPSTFTRQIIVHPTPRAAFEVSPNFLWVGQPLRAYNYTANTTNTGQPYDVWYRWDWGDNTPEDTVQNPSHMYRKAGTYTITLTAGTYTDPVCSTTAVLANAVELETAGDIILPNTFKPRPDMELSPDVNPQGYQNYLFYPPVLSPTRKYSFRIFNRWGQLLFETSNPNQGWNGYFKGRPCDEGVYIYKIEGVFETGQSFSKMGDVLLLR